MANEFSGLFKNNITPQDVYDKMGQEREARIRQAMADNISGGGNYYSSLVARANQQMAEALRGGVDVFGTKAGILREDPRLAKARKLATDKKEIMDIIGKFSDPTSPGGSEITEQELKVGFAELMKRGYPNEAQQFMTNALAMRKLDISEGTMKAQQTSALAKLQKAAAGSNDLKFEGPVMRAKDGSLWQSASTEGGQVKFMKLAGGADAKFDPEGAVIVDTKGQTFIERVKEAGATAEVQEQPKRTTAQLKEQWKRESARLQKDLNIEQAQAEKLASLNLTSRDNFIQAGVIARKGLSNARQLLELSKQIKGGKANEALREFGRIFNIEAKNEASFRTQSQMMMIQALTQLMGAKPTDKDLEELAKAFPGPMQTTEANIAMLERIIKRLEGDAEAGDFFSESSSRTPSDYLIYLRQKETQERKKVNFGDLK